MQQKALMTASTYHHINSFHLPYLREFQRLGWETHVGCAGISGDAPFVNEWIKLPFEKQEGAVAKKLNKNKGPRWQKTVASASCLW